jgi:hypothetical protein
MSTNSGEPDISRLLGGGPAAEDLTGEPRRRRRARKGIDVTPIPDSEMRLRILDRLNTMHMQAFDQWTEQLVKAMLAVLDYHRPWRREIQVFESAQHAGEQQVIAGCRSCSWSYRTDCPTVQAVAHNLGLTQF